MSSSDQVSLNPIATKKKGIASDVDVYVGGRLRERRNLMGLSQEKLADSVGLTFQQVQKYERGTNRVSASRLYEFSSVMDVPVSYFFDGYKASHPAPAGMSDNEQASLVDDDVMSRKETLDLIRVYYSIPDEKLRQRFLGLIKSMASNFS